MDGVIPPNFPAASITLFDLPEKVMITCNPDEMPVERIKAITDGLTTFLSDDSVKVLFLPDDLNLMFFYPRDEVQNAIHTHFNRGNILAASPQESTSDPRPPSGDIEGGEETEDDN